MQWIGSKIKSWDCGSRDQDYSQRIEYARKSLLYKIFIGVWSVYMFDGILFYFLLIKITLQR